ncbi:G-protein coupled receptor Mth isoform X2 [Folsomia candida]|uniref:G-protein coupled receptor Mth n=1 Tax=Folsomia candida TaxID=158441 RepID=A0A226E236_FOLCA|nr:G-protein coupled receptor Mth isoform X2 [Folsomia candida]OXA51338.1 G-protein coupled receptor Mth [Folsomia candida]
MNFTENLLTSRHSENSITGFDPQVPITNENWKLFVTLIVLSTVFLGIAVTLYIILSERQNLHGWTQFSYLVAFLLFNIVFIPALCPGIADGFQANSSCFALAVANQYFFIASKTWLLIIGFDILWNLWKFEYVIDTGKHRKRFVIYSMLGWTFPLGMVCYGVVLNMRNHEEIFGSSYSDGSLWVRVPDYGRRHCRVPSWNVWEIFVFSNCIIHLLMFLVIILLIMKHRCAVQKTLAERREKSYQSFLIFLKLFIVVGLSWSYIALQDLLKAGNINTQQGLEWQIFRVIYFMQGIFISIVYVGNVKTFRQLQEKFPRFKALVVRCQENASCCGQQQARQTSISSSFSIPTYKSKCCTITMVDDNIHKGHTFTFRNIPSISSVNVVQLSNSKEKQTSGEIE